MQEEIGNLIAQLKERKSKVSGALCNDSRPLCKLSISYNESCESWIVCYKIGHFNRWHPIFIKQSDDLSTALQGLLTQTNHL